MISYYVIMRLLQRLDLRALDLLGLDLSVYIYIYIYVFSLTSFFLIFTKHIILYSRYTYIYIYVQTNRLSTTRDNRQCTYGAGGFVLMLLYVFMD